MHVDQMEVKLQNAETEIGEKERRLMEVCSQNGNAMDMYII